jgi:hypothetical protein
MELVDGLCSCCAMSSLVKLMKIAQTPSGSNHVFHRSPEAFHGIEMMDN